MAATEQRVDVWELRCRFNRSRYWELANAQKLDKWRRRRNPASSFGPPGTFQEQWYIRDPWTQDDLAMVSIFVNPDGTPARSPDPKFLKIGGVEFHLRTGAPIKKDPALRWNHGTLRRAIYVWWRKKIKCPVFGR